MRELPLLRYGARNPLIVGCALWTVASFVYGPVPLSLVFQHPTHWQRSWNYAALSVWSVVSGSAVSRRVAHKRGLSFVRSFVRGRPP